MRERLAELYRSFGTPLVGKDGSGGAAGSAAGRRCSLWDAAEAQPGLKREGGCRRRGDRRK